MDLEIVVQLWGHSAQQQRLDVKIEGSCRPIVILMYIQQYIDVDSIYNIEKHTFLVFYTVLTRYQWAERHMLQSQMIE